MPIQKRIYKLGGRLCHGIPVGIRGQFSGAQSVIPPPKSQESHSVHQAWCTWLYLVNGPPSVFLPLGFIQQELISENFYRPTVPPLLVGKLTLAMNMSACRAGKHEAPNGLIPNPISCPHFPTHFSEVTLLRQQQQSRLQDRATTPLKLCSQHLVGRRKGFRAR